MRTLIQFLLSLLTLAAIIWAVWQGYLLIDSRGQQLEPAQRGLLVGLGLIALVCTFMLSAAIRDRAKEHSKGKLLQRRAELYESFATLWQALKTEVNADQKTQLQLQADEFKTSIALYGSSEVLKSINRLLEKAAADGPHQAQSVFEELLLAMRADLGQSNLYPLRNELKQLFSPPKP
jgi:hypothetical protein